MNGLIGCHQFSVRTIISTYPVINSIPWLTAEIRFNSFMTISESDKSHHHTKWYSPERVLYRRLYRSQNSLYLNEFEEEEQPLSTVISRSPS